MRRICWLGLAVGAGWPLHAPASAATEAIAVAVTCVRKFIRVPYARVDWVVRRLRDLKDLYTFDPAGQAGMEAGNRGLLGHKRFACVVDA
jgi:hypothetical protein